MQSFMWADRLKDKEAAAEAKALGEKFAARHAGGARHVCGPDLRDSPGCASQGMSL